MTKPAPPSNSGHRTLSIVIVAYNEEHNLERLAKSIIAQSQISGWDVKVILVDNGSTDNTDQVAMAYDMCILHCDAEKTVAWGRNVGGNNATGDIISFVDADCELNKGWTQEVISSLDGSRGTIVGWPVCPPTPMSWVQRAWQAHWVYKRGHIKDRVCGECAMTMITTANMSMTRDVFHLVGGFDESLQSGEDMNFLLRAYQKNIKIYANSGLKVIHHGEPRTLRDFYQQQQWHCSKKSFREIWSTNNARTGGNALWFTFAYSICFWIGVAGLWGGILLWKWLLVGMTFYFGLLVLPALIIAWRAKSGRLIYELPVLYSLYGWVRMLDMMGVLPEKKKSWRNRVHNGCPK